MRQICLSTTFLNHENEYIYRMKTGSFGSYKSRSDITIIAKILTSLILWLPTFQQIANNSFLLLPLNGEMNSRQFMSCFYILQIYPFPNLYYNTSKQFLLIKYFLLQSDVEFQRALILHDKLDGLPILLIFDYNIW